MYCIRPFTSSSPWNHEDRQKHNYTLTTAATLSLCVSGDLSQQTENVWIMRINGQKLHCCGGKMLLHFAWCS